MQFSIACSSTFICAIQSTALLFCSIWDDHHLGHLGLKAPYCFALKMRCIIGNCALYGSSIICQIVLILYFFVQHILKFGQNCYQVIVNNVFQVVHKCHQILQSF